MIKRIWRFQKLLLNSVESFKPVKVFFVVFLLEFLFKISPTKVVIGATYPMLWFILLPIILLLNISYHSNHKIYKLIPASNRFVFINLYLFPFFFILIMLAALLLLGIIPNLVVFLIFLFSRGKFNPYASGEFWKTDFYDSKVFLFYIFLILILWFCSITIAFIKQKMLRTFSYLTFYMVVIILLSAFDHSIQKLKTDEIYQFSEIFPQMQNANAIVITMAILTVILLPFSVLVSYLLFNRKPKK